MGYRIGVDIGGSHISVGVVNEKGELITKEPYNKDMVITEFAQIIDGMTEGICYCMHEQNILWEEIKQIGISAPGRHQNGKTITWGRNIQIFDTNTEEELRNALEKKDIDSKGINIKIANDVHCAAIAELMSGSLIGSKNAVCLTFGTGVGGGIIINGKLYEGENNLAGRIGHTLVGQATLEELCSIKRLKEKIGEEKGLRNNNIRRRVGQIFRRER